jgi:fucose 4-O-acetylase-like acetyltransferase
MDNNIAAKSTTRRINYIDALRGLSMILVVLSHVFLSMTPNYWDGSPVSSVLMSFRMPLFFFVSGFFAYKSFDRWTSSVVADIMVRKLRAQVLCATLFFMLYQSVKHLPVFDMVEHGYSYFWFTIALFQMFVLYVAINLLARLLRRNIVDATLILLSVASLFFGLYIFKRGVGVVLSWHQVIIYFQYFATGILVRRHWNKFERVLSSNLFCTIVIVLFVAGCFYFYDGYYHEPKDYGRFLTQGVLHRYCGLFTVLTFFHSRREYFNTNARVARFLRFTGKRTLDIYMMHMFFMPQLYATGWFVKLLPPNMVVLKLAVALTIALGIVSLCLLCSNILRTSHFLEVWLFGVRSNPKSIQKAK